jgi:hypothetical protein
MLPDAVSEIAASAMPKNADAENVPGVISAPEPLLELFASLKQT